MTLTPSQRLNIRLFISSINEELVKTRKELDLYRSFHLPSWSRHSQKFAHISEGIVSCDTRLRRLLVDKITYELLLLQPNKCVDSAESERLELQTWVLEQKEEQKDEQKENEFLLERQPPLVRQRS